MPGEALRARLRRQQVAQEDGRVERGSWLSPSTSAFSLRAPLLNLSLCMNLAFVCAYVQLCIHVRVMKGTDTRLVNNRKYNMNVWGVYPCFWCSLLQLIHRHNAHTDYIFFFLITFFPQTSFFIHAYTPCTIESTTTLQPLHISSSVFATTAGRNDTVHKLQSTSLLHLLLSF